MITLVKTDPFTGVQTLYDEETGKQITPSEQILDEKIQQVKKDATDVQDLIKELYRLDLDESTITNIVSNNFSKKYIAGYFVEMLFEKFYNSKKENSLLNTLGDALNPNKIDKP